MQKIPEHWQEGKNKNKANRKKNNKPKQGPEKTNNSENKTNWLTQSEGKTRASRPEAPTKVSTQPPGACGD